MSAAQRVRRISLREVFSLVDVNREGVLHLSEIAALGPDLQACICVCICISTCYLLDRLNIYVYIAIGHHL